MDRQRAYEETLAGDEGALPRALREALRAGAHERVLDLVYTVAPNARHMGPLAALGVDISPDGVLAGALWHGACVTAVEREWFEALGVPDPMTVVAMLAQGVDVPYLMEVYHKVLEDAVGNALDNESDCSYEGVADFVLGRIAAGEALPAWAEHISVESEDGSQSLYTEDTGGWYEAVEAWDRDALLGYVWCQLDAAYDSLTARSAFEGPRWWWSEGFSKRVKTVHKGLSDAWCAAVLHVLFPEDFGDLVVKDPAWWDGAE